MGNRIIEDYVNKEIIKLENPEGHSAYIKNITQTSPEFSLTEFPLHGQIGVVLHTVSANYQPSISPFHSHDFFEMVYVYRGEATQYMEKSILQLKKGSICLMNTNYKHGLSIPSDENIVFNILLTKPLLNTSLLNLISDNELFSGFFVNSLFSNSKSGEFLYFEPNEASRMETLMQFFLEEYILEKPDYSAAMQSYLSLIFTELHRKHIHTFDTAEAYHINFPQIISYATTHIESVTINSLAEHFHYSPNYLSKAMKNYLGKNFSSVLADLKLEKATEYLSKSTVSIDSIVELLSYYDRSYFNKIFRKRYGCSPLEYREKHGAGHNALGKS